MVRYYTYLSVKAVTMKISLKCVECLMLLFLCTFCMADIFLLAEVIGPRILFSGASSLRQLVQTLVVLDQLLVLLQIVM